jgi:hypothetical protein
MQQLPRQLQEKPGEPASSLTQPEFWKARRKVVLWAVVGFCAAAWVLVILLVWRSGALIS